VKVKETEEVSEKKKEWNLKKAEIKAFSVVTNMEKVMKDEPVDRILKIVIGKHRLIKAGLGGV
jgi:hypothetical protein